jgi:hypothetical protein
MYTKTGARRLCIYRGLISKINYARIHCAHNRALKQLLDEVLQEMGDEYDALRKKVQQGEQPGRVVAAPTE